MPDLDIGELERLAKAATPGPWEHDKTHREGKSVLAELPGELVVLDAGRHDWDDMGQCRRDAAYIAVANPAAILALLADLAQANANGASHWSRAIAAEADAAKLREAFRNADPSDWDYLVTVLKAAKRHDDDQQTMFWLSVLPDARQALQTKRRT